MCLKIKPISIHDANVYVEQFHRHHGMKTGCKFAISCYDNDRLCGVAICANPVARNADDGMTLEVSRLCTDGTRNACSMPYGASARIAKEMGYSKIITYILETESGDSLKASGWTLEADNVGALSWQNCNCQREKQRAEKPTQQCLFESKKVPEVMKKRYARYLS